jgi:putative oxygen-independent coproporphyrinogen III oxidase
VQLPPLSLYIHVPWCVKKCPYCDFNSHEATSEIPEKAYLEALLKDFSLDVPYAQGRALTSIFIGGGTPSLMSSDFYQQLLSNIRAQIPFHNDIEITIEANPGTTEAGRFEGYREAGINRLSLGIQSFDDQQLNTLGRIHSAAQATRAVQLAREAGFDNFNIDLMFGLPGQSASQAANDLKQAFALSPSHISWYQLTIEQNTAFYSSPPTLPDDERLWDIQKEGAALLSANGYEQYEVSAYAKNGQQARHNVNYWQFGDYIGVGAGAHSKISDSDSGRLLRYRKSRLPKDYLKPRPLYRVGEELILEEDLPFEYLMNILRLKCGQKQEHFTIRTGLPLSALQPQLDECIDQGLMEKNRLQLTDKGFLFLNDVLAKFVSES